MKLLGIDYGLARTGIAVTDAGSRMAFGRRTLILPPQGRREDFFCALLVCIADENPSALVVGLPLRTDGTDSETTRQVRNFVVKLKRRTALPIYLMPEYLSSHEAEQDLREAGLHGQKLREVVDQQAAVRILESFLADTNPAARRV